MSVSSLLVLSRLDVLKGEGVTCDMKKLLDLAATKVAAGVPVWMISHLLTWQFEEAGLQHKILFLK